MRVLTIAVVACIVVSCAWADTPGEDKPHASTFQLLLLNLPKRPIVNVMLVLLQLKTSVMRFCGNL